MSIDDDEKHLTRNTHSHAHTHQRSNNNYIESTVARKMKPLFNINKKAGLQLWIINVLNWKSFKCYCLNGCCGDLVTLLWLLLSILHSYWQKCAVSKLSKDLKKKKKLTEIAWKNGKNFHEIDETDDWVGIIFCKIRRENVGIRAKKKEYRKKRWMNTSRNRLKSRFSVSTPFDKSSIDTMALFLLFINSV